MNILKFVGKGPLTARSYTGSSLLKNAATRNFSQVISNKTPETQVSFA